MVVLPLYVVDLRLSQIFIYTRFFSCERCITRRRRLTGDPLLRHEEGVIFFISNREIHGACHKTRRDGSNRPRNGNPIKSRNTVLVLLERNAWSTDTGKQQLTTPLPRPRPSLSPPTGKPKHHGINKIKAVRNLRSVAEERVGAKFSNMRVLNSYWVNQDATFKYYEVSQTLHNVFWK